MKAQKKHQYILEQAYKVFIKKGYSQVTMTDIITECEISRGGVYRYFQSTKDIFIALVRQMNLQKSERNFSTFIEYLEHEKTELLNIRKTIRVAGYEFMIQESQTDNNSIAREIYESNIKIILKLTDFNQKQAEQTFLILEGLTAMALTGILTTELIKNHFDYITNMARKI